MMRILVVLSLFFLIGCNSNPSSPPLAHLLSDCSGPGEIIRAELLLPLRCYEYSYRVYLPPCYSAESEFRYPVLYIVPGLGGGPDGWFAAGLAKVADDLILSNEI